MIFSGVMAASSTTPALAASVAARATGDPRTAEAKNPGKALEALTLAAEGESQTAIQAKTGLGKRTVRRLMHDHREAMAQERLKASVRAAESAELARSIAVQRMRMMDPASAENEEEREQRTELLKKTNVRDLSVTYGVLTDKAEKLSDHPEMVAEVTKGPSLDLARKALDEARALTGARSEAEIEKRVAERLREIEGAENVIEIGGGTESKAGRST